MKLKVNLQQQLMHELNFNCFYDANKRVYGIMVNPVMDAPLYKMWLWVKLFWYIVGDDNKIEIAGAVKYWWHFQRAWILYICDIWI